MWKEYDLEKRSYKTVFTREKRDSQYYEGVKCLAFELFYWVFIYSNIEQSCFQLVSFIIFLAALTQNCLILKDDRMLLRMQVLFHVERRLKTRQVFS